MHDTHFLERLPRASYRETEMALGLYRKPELVSAILNAAAAPEVARVAIALSPGEEPAWLIVARDGGFVTCLGSGMSPGDCPRVSHASLTRIATRLEELRTQMAFWTECAENGSGIRRLLRDLYEAGDRVSRESISALVPLGPVLWPHFLTRLPDLDKTSRLIVYDESQRLLRRRDRLSSRDTDLLRCVWANEWAKSHIAVILGGGQRDFMEFYHQRPELEESLPQTFTGLLQYFCRFGFQPHVARGLWFAARFGKLLVRRLKDDLANPKRTVSASVFIPPLALGAIGTRRDKLRAEVAKALDTPDQQTRSGAIRRLMAACLRVDVAAREAHSTRLLTDLAQHLGTHTEPSLDLATASTAQRARLTDLARVMFSNFSTNLWTNADHLFLLLQQLPWVMALEPGDFYHPKEYTIEPWQPAVTLTFFEGLAPDCVLARAPKRVEPKPGRNDLCACGSGKKYKRCCA